jgi:glycine cleavage system H protein
MKVSEKKRFLTEYQEWVIVEGNTATVGLTPEALKELEEIVYVELPKVGAHVSKEERISILETTKAAIDLYAPLAGKVIEVNQRLRETPQLINASPENEGWLYKLELSN